MNQEDILTKLLSSLPDGYFDGKDGTGYRFTIQKDVAAAADAVPVPYDEKTHRQEIFNLYGKYKDFTIYVHFPWCVEHCSYCHYYRGPILKKAELEAMLQAERKHARMMDDNIDLHKKPVRSIYFGGGTPTVIPAEMLEDAIAFYVEHYGKNVECEVCLETSIITLKAKKIDILEKYINRLSIGVQSFDDRILEIIGRKHRAAQTREVLQELVPRFPFINVDLIYGLYKQDLDSWLAGVEETIKLGAQSLTIYRLDIRDVPSIGETFRKEPDQFPDELMCWRMYEEARQMLEKAGYRENLIGWFMLPHIKDTTVYRERWQKQSPCIAFGHRLHNYASDHFYETRMEQQTYIQAVTDGQLPIEHIYPFTPLKQLVWYVVAQWKSNVPIFQSVMVERFGQDLLAWFMGMVKHYIDWGVLKDSGDKIEIAREYHYLLEWVLLDLIKAIK